MVLSLLGLAFQARKGAPLLSLSAITLGLIVPVFGLMQTASGDNTGLAALPLLHLAAGLGGIAVAEMMAKQLRTRATAGI
jgi:hypothetical protein